MARPRPTQSCASFYPRFEYRCASACYVERSYTLLHNLAGRQAWGGGGGGSGGESLFTAKRRPLAQATASATIPLITTECCKPTESTWERSGAHEMKSSESHGRTQLPSNPLTPSRRHARDVCQPPKHFACYARAILGIVSCAVSGDICLTRGVKASINARALACSVSQPQARAAALRAT